MAACASLAFLSSSRFLEIVLLSLCLGGRLGTELHNPGGPYVCVCGTEPVFASQKATQKNWGNYIIEYSHQHLFLGWGKVLLLLFFPVSSSFPRILVGNGICVERSVSLQRSLACLTHFASCHATT